MRKYVQNFWVRFLACILCSVTLVTGAAAGVLLAGVSTIGSKEEVYENGQEIIAENYAAYIFDHLEDVGNDSKIEVTEKLESFLEKKNFTCSITKIYGEAENHQPIEERTRVIYNNLADDTDWDYVFEMSDDTYVRYEVDSVMDALRISPVFEEMLHTVEASIMEYIFDAEAGVFYYATGNAEYFLADYIMVSHDGAYYDYKIKNEDGQKVYYNSYYDLTLDTSQYKEWDWVELNGERLTISQNEEAVGREIIVITDSSSVEPYVYTDIYYLDDRNNTVAYHTNRMTDTYRILVKQNEDLQVGDMFYDWEIICDEIYANTVTYQIDLVISILLFILSFALLIYSANGEKEKMGFLQKVPVGIFTACAIVIEIPLLVLMWDVILGTFEGYYVLPMKVWIILCLITAFAMVFIAVILLQNIISRFKTKTFIRYSELYYGYKIIKWTWEKVTIPFKALSQMVREHTPLVIRALAILAAFSLVEFFIILICWWDMDAYLLFFIPIKIVEILLVIVVAVQMQKLQEGSKRIAAGDLSEPIDTSKMFWEFKKHGENINKVSDGIALAVEDRMKSERFKTELITNVSHDIKTPLTSIINYVDLIKKEEIPDETLKEYVDVLDRQSARLKKLIEDLMEASKASTGNLAVNMEDCDVEVLLTQLIGEFEEKLSANQLEVVVQKPEHPVIISADGRHMWRVFDNLLNNACKYSQPGTRVYVSLVQENNIATITFKNISKAALNIPSDELMERFVRGDSSRNTEGSGLGLSIAQSLTELMKGSMKLEIDGDLFKVTLKFQMSETKKSGK